MEQIEIKSANPARKAEILKKNKQNEKTKKNN